MKRRNLSRGKILGLIILLCFLNVSLAFASSTMLVSVSPQDVAGDGVSDSASISADGKYVAFSSSATDLVLNDSNRASDVFVLDNETGIIERVSISSQGSQGNSWSKNPSISGDGRYVVFESYATNLVQDDKSRKIDIFVHDRLTGITDRVSKGISGQEANSQSSNASISYDGRFIAFESYASNLVPNDTRGLPDIFVYDRLTEQMDRVNVGISGQEANGDSKNASISYDGRFIAFESYASNLVEGDANLAWDIFVYDRQTGVTELASVKSDGGKANFSSMNPAISGDGRYVTFSSSATNLVGNDTNGATDVFLHDRMTGTTERISTINGVEGSGASDYSAVSADGRYVAFESSASNLIPGDTNRAADILVLDRGKGTLELVSVDSDDVQGNSASGKPSISYDGLFIAFESNSTNLDPTRDPASGTDVYIRDRISDNAPPIADAGPDQTVNCSSVNGTEVALDGSGSSDPDGDELTYVWYHPIIGSVTGMTPTVTLPLGTFEFELTVDDGNGETASDTVIITVEDVTPPSTTAVITVPAKALMLQGAGVKEWYNSSVEVVLTATDNCIGCETIYTVLDGVMSEARGSTYTIPISEDGIHELIYWSVDEAGNIESKKSQIIKIDKTAPSLSISVDPKYLWPPNGKMRNVAIQVHASDSSPIQPVSIEIVDEYRKEPDPIEGLSGTVKLKAWRSKKDKDGRHYTIIAKVKDAAGNIGEARAEVIVPHDMKHHHHKKNDKKHKKSKK